MKEIIVKHNSKTVAEYLSARFPLLTTGLQNKYQRKNAIKVNGKKAALKDSLSSGDVITLYIPDDLLISPAPDGSDRYKFSGAMPEIIYEDENLLAVNKPAGLAVISDDIKEYDTLINRVKKHYADYENVCPQLCHRLDTGTCGLVLISKNSEFNLFMTRLFKDHGLKKEYICVVNGKPIEKTYKAFITKNSRQGYSKVSEKPLSASSKPIRTQVSLISNKGSSSLLKIGLITGRTHQIRAHLAHIGTPILGDSKYGVNPLNRKYRLKYQLLCSKNIIFPEIKEASYKNLSGLKITCPDPWFVEKFYDGEFR